MSGDCIIIPSGPNKGIWCRTQAAYDTIAAAAVRRPDLGAQLLDRMPALNTYTGTVVTVASPEKWREVQAEVDAAEKRRPAPPEGAPATTPES